jgi:hypothetical protein
MIRIFFTLALCLLASFQPAWGSGGAENAVLGCLDFVGSIIVAPCRLLETCLGLDAPRSCNYQPDCRIKPAPRIKTEYRTEPECRCEPQSRIEPEGRIECEPPRTGRVKKDLPPRSEKTPDVGQPTEKVTSRSDRPKTTVSPEGRPARPAVPSVETRQASPRPERKADRPPAKEPAEDGAPPDVSAAPRPGLPRPELRDIVPEEEPTARRERRPQERYSAPPSPETPTATRVRRPPGRSVEPLPQEAPSVARDKKQPEKFPEPSPVPAAADRPDRPRIERPVAPEQPEKYTVPAKGGTPVRRRHKAPCGYAPRCY